MASPRDRDRDRDSDRDRETNKLSLLREFDHNNHFGPARGKLLVPNYVL